MVYTTMLHGGVCHRTSTPHKSGNKMKEKEKKKKSLKFHYFQVQILMSCPKLGMVRY